MSVCRFVAATFAASLFFAAPRLAAAADQAAPSVGYQTLSMPDPAGPSVEVGIWYPSEGTPHVQYIGAFQEAVAAGAPVLGDHLPLVVISHGNNGSFTNH